MISLQIADIYLKISESQLETELNDSEQAYSETMTHECNQLRMQRSGQEMLQVIIKNDNGSDFTVVAERDENTGDITFKPNKIRSINKTFFQTSYSDPDDVGQTKDPSMFFVDFMSNLARKYKGTFAYQDASGAAKIIKDGKDIEVEGIAIADTNGNVYTTAGAKSIGAVDESGGSTFHIKKFWKVWLQENTDVALAANNYTDAAEKLTFIAKALIQKKLSDEIEFDEFQDVFIQLCSYGIISDKTVLNFYQILK